MNITKQFTFDSAHQLVGHNGKCANLHGHTYKLEIELCGVAETEEGSSQGMVVDFSDVKAVAKPLISKMDHAALLQGNEPILNAIDTKRIIFGFRTTAENMAKFIFIALATKLPVSKIRLWETPTGCAEYTHRDYTALLNDLSLKDGTSLYDDVWYIADNTGENILHGIEGLLHD